MTVGTEAVIDAKRSIALRLLRASCCVAAHITEAVIAYWFRAA